MVFGVEKEKDTMHLLVLEILDFGRWLKNRLEKDEMRVVWIRFSFIVFVPFCVWFL